MHVIFSGRVQGVGFRYTVRELAKGFEVTGFVKNLINGRVELIAEGTPRQLEEFLEEIENSHMSVFIRNKEVNWSDADGEFNTFSIAS